MGRPALPKDKKQSKGLMVRLTTAEYQVVKRAAKVVPKRSLSAYAREKVLA